MLRSDQIDELISGGVIAKDTYVWRTGMSEWLNADHVPELRNAVPARAEIAATAEPVS